MADMVMVVLGTVSALFLLLAWRAFYSVWMKPMKLQRQLNKQGFTGSPYKLLYGDLKEFASETKEARSKPMELSHDIVPRVFPFLSRKVKEYGKMSFIWFGTTPTLNIIDPDLVRDILSSKFGHFSKIKPHPLGKLLAQGVVAYNGEKWVKHRRIINPAFHLEKLKLMLPAFYTCCTEMITKWENLVTKEPYVMDVWPELQDLTRDVISRTAFGSNFEEGQRIFELQTELAVIVIQLSESVYIPGYRFLPTKTNNRIKEIDREVRTLLTNIIRRREKALKAGEGNNDDLLGLLMESNFREIQDNGNSKNLGMSVNDVIEECKLFYIAGQETTSTLLVWTMIVLSMHPEWQEKAREEVLEVFGQGKPDFEGLNHLKIVTMIFYEILRLYTPVVLLARATYKPMKLGDISIPEGVEIVLPTLLVHHSKELWGEDVNEFKPERFAEGISKATNNQVSYFPFGWGPRICVGQTFALIEAKLALAMILQCFSFELSPTYTHAPYTVITLQPQYGAQLILHKLLFGITHTSTSVVVSIN